MTTNIGVVFDFDDTLAPDSMSAFLESIGVDPDGDFWPKRVQARVKKGWDPIPAQFHALVEESRARPPRERITRERLARFGRSLELFEGVPQIFERLRKRASETNPDVEVEFYLVSCGIGEVIRSSRAARHFERIWASELHYDSEGAIDFTRVVVSHTEKTKFLHRISEGRLEGVERPGAYRTRGATKVHVPLRQIVYVGDGFTDLPCFSLLADHAGVGLGVYKEGTQKRWGALLRPSQRGRVENLARADYRTGSELSESILLAVESLCRLIELKQKIHGDF